MGEEGQEIQTYSHKISKPWGCEFKKQESLQYAKHILHINSLT